MSQIKIATVIPISGGIFKESLTYFTNKDIEIGSLVFVPVRKNKIPAILISQKPTEELKIELKNSNFELRKLDSAINGKILSPEFIRATEKTSDYFAANTGQVINNFISNSFLKSLEKTKGDGFYRNVKGVENKKNVAESFLVQGENDERMAFYKSLIREEFVKNSSIFLFFPTIHELNIFSELLKRGIEDYTIILKHEDSSKKMLSNFNRINSTKHPLLVMGTPTFAFMLNEKFGTIIIEKESSPAYKCIGRPNVDSRYFLEEISKQYGIKTFLGDVVLRIETLFGRDENTHQPSSLFKFKSFNNTARKIIDMNKEEKGKTILSKEVLSILKRTVEEKENTLLLSTRKGLASAACCHDCGTLIDCLKCGGTTVLHKKMGFNIFTCHKCGQSHKTDSLCKKCGSWDIRTIGFGTEKIEEEVNKVIDQKAVKRMDGNNVKNHKEGKVLINEFLSKKGNVLIGTEMALFYLTEPIDNIIIVLPDTLFSIPDFKMNERIFSYLTNARLMSTNNFIIQTRLPDINIFEKIMQGDLLQFYREELNERKIFGYGPYKTIIKITLEDKKDVAEKEMDSIFETLKTWNPEKYKTKSRSSKDKIMANLLIKIDKKDWPTGENKKLLKFLRSLPPNYIIKVDPDSIM